MYTTNERQLNNWRVQFVRHFALIQTNKQNTLTVKGIILLHDLIQNLLICVIYELNIFNPVVLKPETT